MMQTSAAIQIIPIDTGAKLRYPIGFSVSEGFLSNLRHQHLLTGYISSCQRWAGVAANKTKA